MTTFDKIKWILGITLVFLLILMTNLIDRQNFMAVRDSIETIYADRLVAQDIIFDLSKIIWQKEAAYTEGSAGIVRDLKHTELDEGIRIFSTTRLTQQEEVIFARLQSQLEQLKQRENALRQGTGTRAAVVETIASVKEVIDDLFDIQLKEGRRQLFEGKKAVSSADVFTQLEIGALVVLAIAVQVIILYTPGMQRSEKWPEQN